jgi:hypothetical protein
MYYCIAAVPMTISHFSLKDYAKVQEVLDTIPLLLDGTTFNGKELPTEIFKFIRKKCTCVTRSVSLSACFHGRFFFKRRFIKRNKW